MTELMLASVIIAFAFGASFGIFVVGRHFELENEKAYLTGHVDGYQKAEDDAWMEGLV